MLFLLSQMAYCLLAVLFLGWAAGWLWRNWSARQELARQQSLWDLKLERVQRSIESARSELMSTSGFVQSTDIGWRALQDLLQALAGQLRAGVDGLRADFANQERLKRLLDDRVADQNRLTARTDAATARLEEREHLVRILEARIPEIENLRGELGAKAAEAARLNERIAELERALAASEAAPGAGQADDRDSLDPGLEQARAELEAVRGMLAAKETEAHRLEDRLRAEREESEKLRSGASAKDRALEHLQSRVSEMAERISERDGSVESLSQKAAELESRLREYATRGQRIDITQERLDEMAAQAARATQEAESSHARAAGAEEGMAREREQRSDLEARLTLARIEAMAGSASQCGQAALREQLQEVPALRAALEHRERQLRQARQRAAAFAAWERERSSALEFLEGEQRRSAAAAAAAEWRIRTMSERMQELEPLRGALALREQEVGRLRREADDRAQEAINREEYLRGLRHRALELERDLAARDQFIEILQGRTRQLESSSAALNGHSGEADARVNLLSRELENRDQFIRTLENRSAGLEAELVRRGDAEAHLMERLRVLEPLAASLFGAEREVGQLRGALSERDSFIGSLSQRIAELEAALDMSREVVADRDQLRMALEESDRDAERLRNRVEDLEAVARELSSRGFEAEERGARLAELEALTPRLIEQDKRLREWARRFEATVAHKEEIIQSLRKQLAELRLVSAEKTARGAQELLDAQAVVFEAGTAELRPGSDDILDRVAGLLLASPEIAVEIGGRTDDTGDFHSNLDLSNRRAAEVRRQLIARGVAPYRIVGVGYGSGDAARRAIEFSVLPEVPWSQAASAVSRLF